MIDQLLLPAVILFFGSFIQGTVGFAFGLVAMPALIWAGLPLSDAVAMISVANLFQGAFASYDLRRHIPWREVIPATAIRYLTMPLGIVILMMIESWDKAQIRQIIGLVILLVLIAQLLFKMEPKERIHPVWTISTFSLSGIMQGMVAMGGPAVVFWVMVQNWTSQQARAFTLSLFLFSAPVQLLLLYFMTGNQVVAAMLTGLALTPLVFIGTKLGIKCGNQLDRQLLKKLTQLIWAVMAVVSIISPLLT